MAKKSGIQKLLAEQPRIATGRSLKQSLPADLYAAIESDLREVIETEANGQPIPTIRRLLEYVHAEHGLQISYGCVFEWLRRLRNEQNKKPAKRA